MGAHVLKEENKMVDKTFIKITNRDIYTKLCDVETHVIVTNGQVKINKLLSRIALILAVVAIGILTGINLTGIGVI